MSRKVASASSRTPAFLLLRGDGEFCELSWGSRWRGGGSGGWLSDSCGEEGGEGGLEMTAVDGVLDNLEENEERNLEGKANVNFGDVGRLGERGRVEDLASGEDGAEATARDWADSSSLVRGEGGSSLLLDSEKREKNDLPEDSSVSFELCFRSLGLELSPTDSFLVEEEEEEEDKEEVEGVEDKKEEEGADEEVSPTVDDRLLDRSRAGSGSSHLLDSRLLFRERGERGGLAYMADSWGRTSSSLGDRCRALMKSTGLLLLGEEGGEAVGECT